MTALNTTVVALMMAIKNRKPTLVQSMSHKGNYWDNAVAESFFKSHGARDF